jgi:hypothetical protein
MEVVTLPLVMPDFSVHAALRLMTSAARAGVVVAGSQDRYRLLFAGDLLRAREAGVAHVGGITQFEPVQIVNGALASRFDVDLVRPSASAQAYEKLLDDRQAKFALIGEGPRDVMLVTRFEELERMLTLTGGYECTGNNPRHYFPAPYVTVGQDCPLFPACAVPGAPRSTVRPA